MESGLTPGTWQFSLTTLYGSDFEGGHLSQEGNAANGSVVTVPVYRHEVSLDFARVELGLQYTLNADWDVLARVPYEIKDQHASITFVDPATPEERTAMQRNVNLHHRTVTLRGMGDVQVLARRRWSNLAITAGASLPTGETIDNPYRAGDLGIQHTHIQFGTGTVDPLLELSYHRPLANRFSTGVYLAGRVPLYENDHGFRAAPDGTLGVHLAHRPTDRVQLRVEGTLYAQGYAEWDGLRDENTGLIATSITGGATYRFDALSVSADVRYPLSQRTLAEGDAFTQGPTYVISLGRRVPGTRAPAR